MPRTFCEKCINKIKLASNFKRTGTASEDYLRSFVVKINQEFTKSLPTACSNRKESDNEDNDDSELEQLLLEERQDPLTEPTLNSHESLEEQPAVPVAEKIEKPVPSTSVAKKKPATKVEPKVEKESLQEYLDVDTAGLYTEEEQLEDDGMFGEESYDIMEIDNENGNDNIYLDETGKQVMGEEDGEFILVNFKSSDEDLSEKGSNYVVEEVFDAGTLDRDQLGQRKKHVNRMPRELIDKYARSTENNQHMCTKCVKVFSTRTNLIRHIQSHDGYKAYVCSICSKGFTQSGSLKQHMYIHTGERPYKCNFCSREFTQGKTLKFHLRRHTEEKPFVCEYCNTTFRQRDGLKRHLKAKHQVELKFERKASTSEKVFFVNIEDAGNNTDTTSQHETPEVKS